MIKHIIIGIFIGLAIAALGMGFYFRSRNIQQLSIAPSPGITSSTSAQTTTTKKIVFPTSTEAIISPISLSNSIIVPAGANQDYQKAAEEVVIKCNNQNVQLVEVRVKPGDPFLTYYSFRGSCGSGIEEISVNPGYGPVMSKVETDNRKPISIADWKISATEAIHISGLVDSNLISPNSEIDLYLLQDGSSLVWDISGGYTLWSEVRLDATTGQVISHKRTRVPSTQ